MPAIKSSRQPGPPFLNGSRKELALLEAELPLIAAGLAGRPAQPWLWIAPLPLPSPPGMPPRGLSLHPQPPGYAGDLRCRLPLPLASESLGNIVLQHPAAIGVEELLRECARTLMPGGRLWLYVLNPWSPYRLRRDPPAPALRRAGQWYALLQDAGLLPLEAEVRHLGPLWRAPAAGAPLVEGGRLRADCLLVAEKRSAALIPPAPVSLRWHKQPRPA